MNDVTPSTGVWQTINSFYDLRFGVAVGLACLVIGLALRSSKRFPNGGIWLALILLGAILSILIEPDAPKNVPTRAWITKNGMCGAIIGGLAWLFHKPLVVKLSALGKKWLGAEIENGGNTVEFRKDGTEKTTETKEKQP